MKLLSNHVHIKSIPAKQIGVIHLMKDLNEDMNYGGVKVFRVLAVGPGRRNRKGVLLPVECSPGDRVMCHSYFTGPTSMDDGTHIITDDQIIAVLPAPSMGATLYPMKEVQDHEQPIPITNENRTRL